MLRDVTPFSAIAFLLMLGIGAISPILPLFAESFGVSYGLVEAAISAFAAARVFFDLPGGVLAERFGGRVPAALGLSLIAAAAYAALAYATMRGGVRKRNLREVLSGTCWVMKRLP